VSVLTNEARSMMSLAKLKDDARRHEQREEWQNAIDLYLRVLRSAEEGETEFELPLYNRVGDLYIRLGRPADAVRYYEQAADHYAAAGLFNNAIALCNKALRYLPSRVALYRKLGRYSASQGFLTDARRWFLEYAEYMVQKGDLNEALEALADFADSADDPEVRVDYARRLAAHGRAEQAYAEFRKAYAAWLGDGDTEAAARLRDEVREKLPDAPDLAENVTAVEAGPGHRPAALPGYAEDAPLAGDAAPPAAAEAVGAAETAEALPTYEEAEAAQAAPLPTFDDEAAPLPTYEDEPAAEEAEPLAGYEATAAEPETAPAIEAIDGFESTRHEGRAAGEVAEIEGLETHRAEEPAPEVEPLPLLDDEQAREDQAVRAGAADDDAASVAESPVADERHAADGMGEVGVLDASVPPPAEEPLPAFTPEPREDAPPAAMADTAPEADGRAHPEQAADEYVDLFALINPEEDRVHATRFFVEEKAPTGDEDRDFAEMLAEFKAKVAAHVGEDDPGSHYDLGLAYKEMGLIDEAIGEFQVALRAGASRLKVFEELGQCFILKRQPSIAIKILGRAVQGEHRDELEMIGVFYHIGRAYEDLGQTDEARDAYERVLGLDISFRDVMDRIGRL
jgi:tetratricopeptide (TPR) repeat protein